MLKFLAFLLALSYWPLLNALPWNTAKLDEFIESQIACNSTIATTITIVQLDGNDKIAGLYQKGYGYTDPTCQTAGCARADTTTKFCIGSCTKAFTGALLGALLEKNTNYNQTMWDTPLVKLLPPGQANFFGGDPINTKITVRDLLAHRMGIARNDITYKTGLTRDQLLSHAYALNPIGPLEDVWRSSFNYNNFLISLAGYTAEQLAKTSWENLIKDYYYTPLKMTSSEFVHINYATGTNYAHPGLFANNTWNKDPLLDTFSLQYDMIAPAAAVCSNAVDMANYLQFLLKKNMSTSDMISRQVYQDAMSASNLGGGLQVDSRPESAVGIELGATYGFGWWQGMYRGYTNIWHTGDIPGFHSIVSLLPTENLGIFVSTTQDVNVGSSLPPMSIAWYAADMALGLTSWQNITTTCPPPPVIPPVRPPAGEPTLACTVDSKTYAPFAGTYEHPMFGLANVTFDAKLNQLSLSYGPDQEEVLCLWPAADSDKYTLYWLFVSTPFLSMNPAETRGAYAYSTEQKIQFVLDSSGSPTSFLFIAVESQGPPVFMRINNSVTENTSTSSDTTSSTTGTTGNTTTTSTSIKTGVTTSPNNAKGESTVTLPAVINLCVMSLAVLLII